MDEELLFRFCTEFYGYGQPNAHWANVGMEECGCRNLAEAIARINAWHDLGEQRTVPLREFCQRAQIEISRNKTWDFLMRIRLAAEGVEQAQEEERMEEVFATQFGDEDGHSSLLEFMPLPCLSMSAWPWPDWCNVEPRKAHYVRRLAHVREAQLRNILNQSDSPRVIIFYGNSYQNHWLKIADLDQMACIDEFDGKARWGKRDGKLFISTWHPSGIRRKGGKPNVFARRLGEWIRKHLREFEN